MRRITKHILFSSSISYLSKYFIFDTQCTNIRSFKFHDDVIKWKYFPRYWPFVRRIHRSPVNSPPKGQWRGALMFSLICVWINGWVNNGKTGDLRCYRAHYDVIVMFKAGAPTVGMVLVEFILCFSLVWGSKRRRATGPRLNIKTVLSTYGDFHVKDKTVVRTSYL